MRRSSLEPVFVETVPSGLDEGTLYISVRFRTAAHLCACGCGSKVITPIKPAKWRITYDGETVSLWPSVGNWQKPCRSHYVIKKKEVLWHRDWTDREIDAGRAREQRELRQHYERRKVASGALPSSDQPSWPRRVWTRITQFARGILGPR